MSERVGRYKLIEGEPVATGWVVQASRRHCQPEIDADSRAKFQITGEEYLPWDIIRCSCGLYWVLSPYTNGPNYFLIQISEFKVRRKLGYPLITWKTLPIRTEVGSS